MIAVWWSKHHVEVITTFAELFSGLGAQLPLPHPIVIAPSERCSRVILIVGVASSVGAKTYYDTTGSGMITGSA